MPENDLYFIRSSGEMSEMFISTAWSETSLGSIESWPENLKTATSMMLNSGFPIGIYWGNDFTLLYNDPWKTIPGNKHPWALGKPGAVVWPEIWEGLRHEFESVLEQAESYRRPDVQLFMHRYGYTEECYFDYTLSPIYNHDGSVGGVLNAALETTDKVIHARRQDILFRLVEHAHAAKNEAHAVELISSILQTARADISFSALYIKNKNDQREVTFKPITGIDQACLGQLDLQKSDILNGEIRHLKGLADKPDTCIFGLWPEPVEEALLVPLKSDSEIKGAILLGASSRKRIDSEYKNFLSTVAVHISTILNNTHARQINEAFEKEQVLNEELAATNEELSATNEELQIVHERLQKLAHELEERVMLRTRELEVAKQEAAMERDRLKDFFMQAPAGICVLDGPELKFELVNPPYQQLFPGRTLLGMPVLEALPELKGQPIEQILYDVYRTGKIFEGKELLVPLSRTTDGPVEDRYFNFIYQPRYNQQKQIDGILVFVFEITDMVVSKLQIRKSESNLQALVMTSHYPLMILKGLDFRIDIANQQLANLWGKSLDNILGKLLLDVLPELEGQPFPDLLRQVYDTGEPYGQEEEVFYLNTDKGTEAKYISFYYDPLIDENGKVSGIIVAANDITNVVTSRKLLEESNEKQQALNEEIVATNEELAAANEELQTTNEELYLTQRNLEDALSGIAISEQRFQNLIRDADVGIILLTGHEMRVTVVNDTYAALIGRKATDLQGKLLFEVIPEAEEYFRSIIDPVRDTGEPTYLYDYPYFVYNGDQKIEGFLNLTYQPYRETDGTVTGVMVLCQNVTEQVASRKKLEENEKQLRFMLNAIPTQVWTSEANGQLNYVNSVVCNDFGHSSEEIVRAGLRKFIHPDDLPGALKKWESALQSGTTYVAEFRLQMPDGTYRWHLARALPYCEDKKIVLWLGTNTDIEIQKQNEQKKDEFLSIASHELKTPLTSIKAFNQLMNRTQNVEKLQNFIGKSGEHIFRLEKLINDLLDVTKINAGRLSYDMQTFNFADLLKSSVESVRHLSVKHEIKLLHAPDIDYYGDQYRLEQVLHNFLTNAVKYSPDADQVLVDAEVDEKGITVSVQDFGIGIAKEHLDKLFERYYRVDNTAMRFEGLGLGLFISSVIIERHHGTFWIESELGKGSTFRFRLPLTYNNSHHENGLNTAVSAADNAVINQDEALL